MNEPPPASAQQHVLCIDDDPSNLKVRKILLESAGFAALPASSAKEGLSLFSSHAVDAVIVDYSMPEIDGGVVAARIKQAKPRIPIIMLTAYPGVREGVEDVVDAFIEKGGSAAALLSRLRSLIALRSHSHPELQSDYVVFTNTSRQFLDCSDGVCKLLGYGRAELLDKKIDDISYLSEEVPALFEQYQRKKSFDGDHVVRHKRGRPVAIHFRSFVFPDGCLAAAWEPITNWKELYQAALLELKPARLKWRQEVALLAIHQRLRELDKGSSQEESIALNDALRGLRVLDKNIA